MATNTGLERNVAAALCYVLGWVSGIALLLLERDDRLVRFHAWQSILTFGGISVVGFVLEIVPFFGGLLQSLVSLLGLALWLVLIFKAYHKERFKLPVIGDLAEDLAS